MANWTGSLPSFTALTKPPASALQTVTDAVHGLTDAETSWSPVVKYGTTSWTLGNAVVDATYRQAGKLAFVSLGLKVGSTTNGNGGSGAWLVVPPVAPRRASADYPVGFGFAIDASAPANYPVMVYYQAASSALAFIVMATSVVVSSSSPFTPAVGDELRLNCTYECA